MRLETRDAGITFSTTVTNIGFLSVVYMSVEFHMNPLGIYLHASGTTVRFFSCVQPEMGFQVGGGAEPFSAFRAFMGFFA